MLVHRDHVVGRIVDGDHKILIFYFVESPLSVS